MYYPAPKETHIVCQRPPSSFFLHCKGECLSVPQLHGYGWSRRDAAKVVPPRGARVLLISAESFSGERSFSKHKHGTWWMWCQHRAFNRSIWPSQINLGFYDLEQCAGRASTQQVIDSGVGLLWELKKWLTNLRVLWCERSITLNMFLILLVWINIFELFFTLSLWYTSYWCADTVYISFLSIRQNIIIRVHSRPPLYEKCPEITTVSVI